VFNFNSQSGKIAQELDYVNHHVRTKLDEIKRREVERLRELANQAYELSNDIDRKHLKVSQHLDHDNEHTFEIEDLRKLIQKTSDDLAEADRKRRGEFKEYEMQKEFEREAQKKEMDEESRKKFETELKEKEEKHKDHEKLHHPGNKAQLEDVWEKQDHMDKNDFDPKTFFSIHDVDSNGYWDEAEVKALFVKELDKVYQSDLPEDDMRERAEEMERMREHYFQETDMNHDGLISIDEFMVQTNKEEFQKDPEWETIDRQQQYTHEEYLEYERRRQEEVQRLIAQGQLPPHPNMPQGYYAAPPPGGVAYQQAPPGAQLHYQHPDQVHAQQQQQYAQQQQQYAQQYQQQQYGNGQQPVQLQPNQVYQHAGQIPQQQQPVYQNQPVYQQQQPVYQQQQPVQQQQKPVQQPVQQQQQPVQQQQHCAAACAAAAANCAATATSTAAAANCPTATRSTTTDPQSESSARSESTGASAAATETASRIIKSTTLSIPLLTHFFWGMQAKHYTLLVTRTQCDWTEIAH